MEMCFSSTALPMEPGVALVTLVLQKGCGAQETSKTKVPPQVLWSKHWSQIHIFHNLTKLCIRLTVQNNNTHVLKYDSCARPQNLIETTSS